MTKPVVAVGDVFLVPLDKDRYRIGQVAGSWENELYVVVYDKLVSHEGTPSDLTDAEIQLAALTLDAKFFHGRWRVIGNRRDNLGQIPQPWFKVRIRGVPHVEARDRSVSRPATANEAAQLRYRTVSSPAVVEGALKALHGLADWTPAYEELRADYAVQSARLIVR